MQLDFQLFCTESLKFGILRIFSKTRTKTHLAGHKTPSVTMWFYDTKDDFM